MSSTINCDDDGDDVDGDGDEGDVDGDVVVIGSVDGGNQRHRGKRLSSTINCLLLLKVFCKSDDDEDVSSNS